MRADIFNFSSVWKHKQTFPTRPLFLASAPWLSRNKSCKCVVRENLWRYCVNHSFHNESIVVNLTDGRVLIKIFSLDFFCLFWKNLGFYCTFEITVYYSEDGKRNVWNISMKLKSTESFLYLPLLWLLLWYNIEYTVILSTPLPYLFFYNTSIQGYNNKSRI